MASARHFIEFALRHTLPERAKAFTYEETYSMLRYHPAAIAMLGKPDDKSLREKAGDANASDA